MVLAQDLRDAILQAALQGKLTEQLNSDTSVEITLSNIQENKKTICSNKKSENIIYNEVPIFDIPNSWRWVYLENITQYVTDGKHGDCRDELNSGYYFISAKDIYDGKIHYENARQIIYQDFEEVDRRTFLEKNCILVPNTGASIGRTALVEDIPETRKTTFQKSIAIIKCFDSIYSIQYLRYVVQYMVNKFKGDNTGTAMVNLLLGDMRKFPVPFPPIEEQQRIVDKVEELMEKIDEYEKVEKQLLALNKAFPGDMKSSILQAAMQGKLTERLDSDSSVESIIEYIKEHHNTKIKEVENKTNYEFPENWKCVKLVDTTSIYTGNSISENIKNVKYKGLEEGYDYIGTKDVGFDHIISYENGVKIPYDEPKFKYAEKDATLLCIEGGSAGKKIAILDRKVCFGNKLCAFHPIGINKKYLYYYLQSPIFLSSFMDKISGIIGGVSISKIKQVIIPLPSIEEQQRIVEKIEQFLPLCAELN